MPLYRAQPWGNSPSKWRPIEARSMAEAAAKLGAEVAELERPVGGHVVINVVDEARGSHPNGNPKVSHRYQITALEK